MKKLNDAFPKMLNRCYEVALVRLMLSMVFALILFLCQATSILAADEDSVQLSSTFYQTPLEDVLNELSFQADLTIVNIAGGDYQISAVLENVNVDEALQIVLKQTKLNYTLDDATKQVIVYDSAQKSIFTLAADKQRVVTLEWLTAGELSDAVPDAFATHIFFTNKMQRNVLISAPNTIIEQITSFVSELDVPEKLTVRSIRVKSDVATIQAILDENLGVKSYVWGDRKEITVIASPKKIQAAMELINLVDENVAFSELGELKIYPLPAKQPKIYTEIIPEAFKQKILFDEATASLIVVGSAEVHNWASDFSKIFNASPEASLEVYHFEADQEVDLKELFPENLRRYLLQSGGENILVAYGPDRELRRIDKIANNLQAMFIQDSVTVHHVPQISGKAVQALIPDQFKDQISVDEENQIIITRSNSEGHSWVNELVRQLNEKNRTTSKVMTLNSLKGDDIDEIIPERLKDYVSFDATGKRLLIHGPKARVEELENLIIIFEQQPQQVNAGIVYKFNHFSVVDLQKSLPDSLTDYVAFDERSKKAIIYAPESISSDIINIFRELDAPENYTTELFRYVSFSGESLKSIVPKDMESFVSIDEETSSILVTGPSEVVEYFRGLVAATKPQSDQIVLEAKIVAFDNDNSVVMGSEFNWPDIAAGLALADETFEPSSNGLYRPWEIQFGYTPDREFTNALNVSLEMLAQNSEATIYARPTIVTENGSTAEIKVATAEYVKVEFRENGEANADLEEIETGTFLKIKPTIENDLITLEINVDVSDVVARGADNLPVVISRSASNRVTLQNGGTAAIAGLVDYRTTGRNAGIPGVRDLPLFRTLGAKRSETNNVKQVAIFITARAKAINDDFDQMTVALPRLQELSSDADFITDLKKELTNVAN